MNSCIFCDILEGKAEASIVYRDDTCCAFMDNQPANPGHVLVIPIQHAASMSELSEETGGHLFQIGMRIAEALRRSALECDGINVHLADSAPAGQEIFHLHLHVIPRVRGDGFGFKFGRGRPLQAPREELDTAAETIRRTL